MSRLTGTVWKLTLTGCPGDRRWAPPGAKGTMIVSSETLPSRLPTRPALYTGGGCALDASDASLLSTVSSAFLPTSGASANSSRSWLIFSSRSAPVRARSP